jgi:hypothetical protein
MISESMALVAGALAQIRAGFDTLLQVDLTPLTAPQMTSVLEELEVECRRRESVDQRLIADVGVRNIAGDYGATSTLGLLVDLLRISPREAKARVARARDMGPRRAPCTGEPLQPILPLVAAAQQAGSISAEHASVIARAIEAIPAHLAAKFTGLVEATLVDQALHLDPGQVAKGGQLLLARIDQDGVEPREEELQRRRDFGIRDNRDGTGTPYGRFSAELCAVWKPILDALSAPQPDEETGEPDERSAGQRRHDALLEAGLRLLRSRSLPECGGAPVTVLGQLSETQLREQTGYTTTAHGDLIPVSTLLRLASEALIIPVVFDAAGGILSYGQRRRLASCKQRLALAARDKGCCFPGCTRPPAWCEAHHVIPWYLGGPTNLDNLCLLCAYHHREFEQRGWIVRIVDGVPEWLPPAWLDAERKPRRNNAHHLTDFDFADTG